MSAFGYPGPDGDPRAEFENWLEEPPPAAALVCCWRCGKHVNPIRGICPMCRAPLGAAGMGAQKAPSDVHPEATAITTLICVFGGMLAISAFFGFVVQFGFADVNKADAATFRRQLYFMLAIEAVDTVLVLSAFFIMARPSPQGQPDAMTRSGAWISALPLLALLLCLNFAYHAFLRWLMHLPPWFNEAVGKSELTGLSLLAVCIQPALIEELFFRRLALDTLRRSMGLHAAVLVSAVMFGMAHIGVPLSIPILIVLGMAFGYARVASNSLALPMLMHFLHNLAVLAFESFR